ncbi:hypothetical protein M885DRAFT_505436 [Pelagophyceae sp. CCMP2097]|nr:hypothetical protein M885DRAFT_505436 [Pelagophyceae sp. CCMP2097]
MSFLTVKAGCGVRVRDVVVVTAPTLALRKWADEDAPILFEAGKDTALVCTEVGSGAWVLVHTEGKKPKGGWMCADAGGFASNDSGGGQVLKLKVMHPEHATQRLATVEVAEPKRTTIAELKMTICSSTGLQDYLLVPVKKFGADADEGSKARLEAKFANHVNWVPCDAAKDTVQSVGYASGDTFTFIYLGSADDDLKAELRSCKPERNAEDSDKDD